MALGQAIFVGVSLFLVGLALDFAFQLGVLLARIKASKQRIAYLDLLLKYKD